MSKKLSIRKAFVIGMTAAIVGSGLYSQPASSMGTSTEKNMAGMGYLLENCAVTATDSAVVATESAVSSTASAVVVTQSAITATDSAVAATESAVISTANEKDKKKDTKKVSSEKSKKKTKKKKKTASKKKKAAKKSEKGKKVAKYAKKFIGNRYVYGGTSLKRGTDCSGFTMSVYKKFGRKLPRTSSAQSRVGKTVRVSKAQPGDLVFYRRKGRVHHVALYIGKGKVVHAAGKKWGIITSRMNYHKIYRVKRVL